MPCISREDFNGSHCSGRSNHNFIVPHLGLGYSKLLCASILNFVLILMLTFNSLQSEIIGNGNIF